MGLFKKAIKKHRTSFKEKLNKKLKIEPFKKIQDFNKKVVEKHKDFAHDLKKGVQDFNHKALERHKELAQNIKKGVNTLNDKRQDFNQKALEKHKLFGQSLGNKFGSAFRNRKLDGSSDESIEDLNDLSQLNEFETNQEFSQESEPTIYYDKNGNEIFRA